MRCTGELHIVSMWPALPLIPSDRLFTCLRAVALVSRVQEVVSEDSWHLFFMRRASTPWSSIRRRSSPLSAIRSRGGLRLPGMGASELCERPCSFVGQAGACAIGCSRTLYCEFLRVSVCFVILAMLVVSACRVKCMSML